jgi:DNA-binding beta-propeller fold protein YncE
MDKIVSLFGIQTSRRTALGAIGAAVGCGAGTDRPELANAHDALTKCKKINDKKKRKKCTKKAKRHNATHRENAFCADTTTKTPCKEGCRVCQLGAFEPDDDPFGIAVSPSNELVATTDADRLDVFSTSGQLLRRIGEFGIDPGEFNFPRGIAIGSDGAIFVADEDNERVQRLLPNGETDVWPQDGFPRGIAVNDAGVVYTTFNSQVHRLDADGQVAYSWGPAGLETLDFDFPAGVAVDGNVVYVVDEGANFVYRFTDDGPGAITENWSFGAPGVDPSEFRNPWGIATDGNRVYVADSSNRRVQAFNSTNAVFQFQWVVRDADDFVAFPDAVAVGTNGRVYVTSFDGITTFEVRNV